MNLRGENLMASKTLLAITALALLSSACVELQQLKLETGETAGTAAAATSNFIDDTTYTVMSTTKSVKQRMASYMQRKELLKTYGEAGAYGEDALVYLRRRTSIGGFNEGKLPEFKSFDMPELPKDYAGEYHWPVEAGIVSSEYGRRFGKLHKGIDVAADIGEPIHAIADGYVVYAGDKIEGYGNIVVLRHDETIITLYAHNSRLKVKTGQHVTQGQVIALLGNTGRSTGPHSHFEVRRQELPVNPREVLAKGPFDAPTQHAELNPLTEFILAWRE
jgi:murein DD-endopeptidase MepM/ murein hydrolase activator NlpD